MSKWRSYPYQALLLLLLVYCACVEYVELNRFRTVFWDLSICKQALTWDVQEALQQRSPMLKYVYPPLAIHVLRAVSFVGMEILIVSNLLIFGLALSFAKKLDLSGGYLARSILLMFSFSGMALTSFVTGNLVLSLYSIVLFTAYLWVEAGFRNRLAALVVGILLASIFKPFFLSFCLVFFMKDFRFGVRVSSTVALIYVALHLSLADVSEYRHWFAVIQRLSHTFSYDIGDNLVRLVVQQAMGQSTSSFIMFFIVNTVLNLSIGFFLLRDFLRGKGFDRSPLFVLGNVALLCLAMNPRLKIYDLFLMGFMALCLIERLLPRNKRFYFVVSALLLVLVTNSLMPRSMHSIWLTQILVMAYWCIYFAKVVHWNRAIPADRVTSRLPRGGGSEASFT